MTECKICYKNINTDNIACLKCWGDVTEHIICKMCYQRESQRRKDNGFDYPNECLLCRPHQPRIIQITNQYTELWHYVD